MFSSELTKYMDIPDKTPILPDWVRSQWNRVPVKKLMDEMKSRLMTLGYKVTAPKYSSSENKAINACSWVVEEHGLELPDDLYLRIAIQTGSSRHRSTVLYLGVESEDGEAVVLRKNVLPPIGSSTLRSAMQRGLTKIMADLDGIEMAVDRLKMKQANYEHLGMATMQLVLQDDLPMNRLGVALRIIWEEKQLLLWDVLCIFSKSTDHLSPLRQMPLRHEFYLTLRRTLAKTSNTSSPIS